MWERLHKLEMYAAKMYNSFMMLVCSEEIYKMIKNIHAQHANPRTQRTYKCALKTYDVRQHYQHVLLKVNAYWICLYTLYIYDTIALLILSASQHLACCLQKWINNEVADHDGIVREQEVIRFLLGSFRNTLNKFSKASACQIYMYTVLAFCNPRTCLVPVY